MTRMLRLSADWRRIHSGGLAALSSNRKKEKGTRFVLGFTEAAGDIADDPHDADLASSRQRTYRGFLEAIEIGAGGVCERRALWSTPMERRAMRLLICEAILWVGVLLVAQAEWKDTLCGTKVLRKSDYEKLAANRVFRLRPFGDFDLFGAAKMNLKILDLPVRYQERTYGTTELSALSLDTDCCCYA